MLCREGLHVRLQIRHLCTARDLQEEIQFDFDDVNFDFMHEVDSGVKAYNKRRLRLIMHYAYCKENNLVMKLTTAEKKK